MRQHGYPREDYHIHTYYSDGTLSPTEVVRWAVSRGLRSIAITDHDGIDGVKEASAAGLDAGIVVIPGIEFSAVNEDGIGLHILGYNIDIDDKDLIHRCEEIRLRRQERNDPFYHAPRQDGYPLESKDFYSREGPTYIGKPQFARALVRKGYIDSVAEAFDTVFTGQRYRSIRKNKITAADAIALIRGAGGTAVLAHPAKIRHIGARGTKEFYDNLTAILKKLKKQGLSGLECYYPVHTDEEEERFAAIAAKLELSRTRVTDYHGPEMEETHEDL